MPLAFLVVFLLLYLLFLRPAQKTFFASWAAAGTKTPQRVRQLPSPGNVQTPVSVRQLEAQLAGSAGTDAYAGTAERDFLPLPSANKMDLIRKRVVEHAAQDPETVARLVRVWLSDEKAR